MVNIASISAIQSGDGIFADVVTNNFSQVQIALNSSAVNSENYGNSSIQSNKISTSQILSQHLSNSQVVSGKFTDAAIVQTHMDYAQIDGGVKVLQWGSVSSDMPAEGVADAFLSQTLALDSVNTHVITHAWSDSLWGDPGYTGSPYVRQPVFQLAAASDSSPLNCNMTALDSVSAVIKYYYSATQDVTQTVLLRAVGPK